MEIQGMNQELLHFNSINGVGVTQQSQGMGNGPEGMGKPGGRPPGPPPDQMQSSQMGQLLNTVRQEESATHEEVKSFMDQIMQGAQNGTLDTESIAKNAPDWLKEAAEASGISIEDAVNEMVDQFSSYSIA